MERHHRGDGFERAGSAERVAVHGFRGADGELVRVRAEDFADRLRLDGIVARRAGAVRVDVADFLGRHSRFAQSAAHGARRAIARSAESGGARPKSCPCRRSRRKFSRRAPCAASIGSRIIIAPPSPRIMPRRSLLNGRQVSGATTRIASQAFSMPMVKNASAPPVTARSASPSRTRRNACPMA